MNRQQKFYKTLHDGLKKIGLKEKNELDKFPFTMYPHHLKTKYGELLIHIDADKDSRKSKTYTCYTRFVDIKKAKEHVDCNPFSGKWNFHYLVEDDTPEDTAEYILNVIRVNVC